MNIKCSVYVATSVDGFIAKPDGDIEWLHRPEYGASEMKGLRYDDFMSSVDALVMGRNTYEKVLSFPEWPYASTPVIVLSTKTKDVPQHLQGKVRFLAGAPERVVSELAAEGRTHLYIDGGVTIQQFLHAGLIDELTITRIPVLLGAGIPLFGHLATEQRLRLIRADESENGFVQERYKVERSANGS